MRAYAVQLIDGTDVTIRAKDSDTIHELFNIVASISGIECITLYSEPDYTIITPGDD